MNCIYCESSTESISKHTFICNSCNCRFGLNIKTSELILILIDCGSHYIYLDKLPSGWATEIYSRQDSELFFRFDYKLDVSPQNINQIIERLIKLKAFT